MKSKAVLSAGKNTFCPCASSCQTSCKNRIPKIKPRSSLLVSLNLCELNSLILCKRQNCSYGKNWIAERGRQQIMLKVYLRKTEYWASGSCQGCHSHFYNTMYCCVWKGLLFLAISLFPDEDFCFGVCFLLLFLFFFFSFLLFYFQYFIFNK